MKLEDMTPSQQRAVNTRGAALVYAAAGSGKTAVLTERVKQILLDENDVTEADRLLVVTFTNAAAAEMRDRIAAALGEGDAACSASHLWRQQMLLAGASIGTIDSFCVGLLRDHFEPLGLQPDFRVTDASRTTDEITAALQKALLERENDPDFGGVADAIGISDDLGYLRKTVMSVYESVRALPDPDGWLRAAAEAYRPGTAASWKEQIFRLAADTVEQRFAQLSTVLYEVREDPTAQAKFDIALTYLLEHLTRLREAIKVRDWDAAHGLCVDFAPPSPKKRDKNDPPVVSMARAVFDEIRKTVRDNLSKLFYAEEAVVDAHLAREYPLVRAFAEFVITFGKYYRELLIERNLLTFDMVEHMAYDLICDVDENGDPVLTSLGQTVSDRYRYVFADEYQDTNSLQNALLFALSDGGKKLFMVGDAKQSIYGFRHAYPRQFIRYREAYKTAEEAPSPEKEKVILDANFRSRQTVCHFTNFLFGVTMKERSSELDYDQNDRMTPGTPEQAGGVPVELALVESAEEQKSAEASAQYIARYIRNAMADETFLLPDGRDKPPRRARYGDFAVLMRAAGAKGLTYLRELRRAGIPVSFSSDTFLDSAEVLTVIHLLKAIDHPTSDVSLLAALTGPLFGVSAETLARIRAAEKSDSIYGCLLAAAEKDPALRKAADRLADLRREALCKTVSAFTRDLCEREMLFEIAGSGEEGERRIANLDLLLGLMEEYDTADHGDLAGFLRYFDRLAETDGSVRSAEAAGEDAVRIMTVHASKGLEFPVCFVTECGSRFNITDASATVRMEADTGLSLPLVSLLDHTKVKPVSAAVIADAITRKLKAEEQRLLYVAVTRARERLILVIDGSAYDEEKIKEMAGAVTAAERQAGTLTPETVLSASSFADWILSAALLHRDGETLDGHLANFGTAGTFTVNRVSPFSADEALAEKETPAADEELVRQLTERFDYCYPHPEAALLSKTTVTRMMAEDGEERYGFSRRPALVSRGGLTPSERGTAAHTFLQYADYAAARRDLASEIERLTEWEYLSEEQAASLDRKALAAFFDSDLCRRICAASRCEREMNFLVPLEEQPETLVQGCVDLLFDEEDGQVLVDFKTTRYDRDEAFREHYRTQLQVYAAAAEAIRERPVKAAYLYSLHLSRVIEVDLTQK